MVNLDATSPAVASTTGTLLGGRVRYRQAATGFRSGLEAVLLAASVPARDGDSVLEAGTGAGAALLCLHARLRGVRTCGVELDAATAALATANARANDFADMHVQTGAIEDVVLQERFDHAIANPPYHAADGTRSADPARERAKRATGGLLAAWINRLSRSLRYRGTLTLIIPSRLVPDCLAHMAECGCAGVALYPLWPSMNRPAKLVLLRGIRCGRSAMQVLPGLVLHESDGSFTAKARSILEGASALPLDAQPSRQQD